VVTGEVPVLLPVLVVWLGEVGVVSTTLLKFIRLSTTWAEVVAAEELVEAPGPAFAAYCVEASICERPKSAPGVEQPTPPPFPGIGSCMKQSQSASQQNPRSSGLLLAQSCQLGSAHLGSAITSAEQLFADSD
jgi:hypothetical protein